MTPATADTDTVHAVQMTSIAFVGAPVTSSVDTYNHPTSSYCPPAIFELCGLCRSSLLPASTAPDDLILLAERNQLANVLATNKTATEDPTCLCKTTLEVILCLTCMQRTKACRHSSRWWWLFTLIQVLLFVPVCLFLMLEMSKQYHCTPPYSEHRFHCPRVQQKLINISDVDVKGQMEALNWTHSEPSAHASFSGKRSVVATNDEISFVTWRATTNNSYFPSTLIEMLTALLVILGNYWTMGSGTNDPEEVLFPPLLSWKLRENNENEGKAAQEDAGKKNDREGRGDGNTAILSLRRPRRLIYHALALGSPIMLSLLLSIGMYSANKVASPFRSFAVIVICLCLIVPSLLIITGLIVQISNSTHLAQSLVLCQTQEDFFKWKKWYKTIVGALHVWSWRMSPGVLVMLMFSVFNVLIHMTRLVQIYFHTAGVTKECASKSLAIFVQPLIGSATGVAVALGGLALISSRYKRINVLIATMQFKDGHAKGFGNQMVLADLELLQQHHASFTLFDYPIDVPTWLFAVRLLFVTTLVALIASFS